MITISTEPQSGTTHDLRGHRFFLALAQPRDALHARAVAWAKAVSEPLLVTEYVLWVTVNAFSIVLEDVDFLVDPGQERLVPRDPRFVVNELE